MNEIKFRAWDNQENKFAEIAAFIFTKNGTPPVTYTTREDDRFVFQLFIGLNDRNGNPIYDGDIVRYTANKNASESYTRRVENCNGYWSPMVSLSHEDGNMQDEFYFEVIGNIFEHPELLS